MPRGSASPKRRRAVRQYSLDGLILGEYACIAKVLLEQPKWHDAGIRKCCLRQHNANSAYGFVWRFVDSDDLYTMSVEDRRKLIRSLLSPAYFPDTIRMYTLFGELVSEFSSVLDIEDEYGFLKDSITKCCKRFKSYKTAYAYVWRYASDDELYNLSVLERQKLLYVIRKYTRDGEFVDMFSSLQDAQHSVKQAVGVCITACYKRRRPTGFGFVWRLASDDDLADRADNARAIEGWRLSHSVAS